MEGFLTEGIFDNLGERSYNLGSGYFIDVGDRIQEVVEQEGDVGSSILAKKFKFVCRYGDKNMQILLSENVAERWRFEEGGGVKSHLE